MLYTYRCDQGHEELVSHGMGEKGPELCPFVACECCGACCSPTRIVVTKAPAMSTRRFDQATGYQPTLAAFPGDPRAFTDGRQSLAKLIDERHREGWRQAPDPSTTTKRPRVAGAEGQEALGKRVLREAMAMRQRGELMACKPESPDAEPEV